MKKQHYMMHDERQQLEALYKAKIPIAQIARQLGFCRQTIYNELKIGSYEHERNGFLKKRYSANKADIIHEENQTAKGRPLKIGSDREYADYLEKMMPGCGDIFRIGILTLGAGKRFYAGQEAGRSLGNGRDVIMHTSPRGFRGRRTAIRRDVVDIINRIALFNCL